MASADWIEHVSRAEKAENETLTGDVYKCQSKASVRHGKKEKRHISCGDLKGGDHLEKGDQRLQVMKLAYF